MRSHGWGGNRPVSDEDAIERILDAATVLLHERGDKARLTELAARVGVTRQTLYHYFSGMQAVRIALGLRATHGLLDRLAAHVAGTTDPVDAVTEAVVFAWEAIEDDKVIKATLARQEAQGRHATSTVTARTFGRAFLQQLSVDWHAHGYDDEDLDELAELALRTLFSLVRDPGDPPRDPEAMRAFVRRWLGPAIIYPPIRRAAASISR